MNTEQAAKFDAMDTQVSANFWYGASRYPVHEDQQAELKQVVRQHINALVHEVTQRMSKWSGGHSLDVEIANMTIVGDGYNVEITVGDPQWYVTQAMRETASETIPGATI